MTVKQTNYFSKLPNKLFYSVDTDKKSILANTNYDHRTLFVLDYLYMNRNMRNITNFYLKDMIVECGFTYSTKKDASSDRFKEILSILQTNNIINSNVNFVDLKVNDKITCTLDIDLDTQFFMLYDSEKNKILSQTTVDKIDNNKLLLYYCYLKCRMYKRTDGDDIEKYGGRAEVAYPAFKLINEDLGITDVSIDKYNHALVELDLIRYDSAGLWHYADDPHRIPRESCNIYALYTDDETTANNLKEGIKFYKKLNADKVFSKKEYKNNNRKLNGELGSIIKKEKLGTATNEDIIRKAEILTSTTRTDEVVVKDNYADFRSIIDVKGKGLQNKKKVIVEDIPDIFEDSFDEDDSDYELTEAEQILNQEIINANRNQIPDEVLREMEEQNFYNNERVLICR